MQTVRRVALALALAGAVASLPGCAVAQPIVGKGEVYSLRWNHYLPRLGEYTSRVIVGYDLKDMIIENCVPTGNCDAVTTQKNRIQPVSFTYAGQRMQPGSLLDYNVGVTFGDQQDILPTNNGANNIPGFSAYRGNFSYLQGLKNDWACATTSAASTPQPITAARCRSACPRSSSSASPAPTWCAASSSAPCPATAATS